MLLIQYKGNEHSAQWDAFVLNSLNGTFLHTRSFLSYHGDRFEDQSYLIFDDQKKLIAVFPAAVSLSEPSTIESHPGITYGGLIFGARCRGGTCVTVLQQLIECYKDRGYNKLVYKLVPDIFRNILCQDDVYALFRAGSLILRCDISATIDLGKRGRLTKGRKYEINKAKKRQLKVVEGRNLIDDIYGIIEENLRSRHEAKPVHTRDELSELSMRFPEKIKFRAITSGQDILAGIVLFYIGDVVHTQYIGSRPEAHECGALDYLLEHLIQEAKEHGYAYFDFGTSNEDNGRVLNESLYRYKRSFGAGSVSYAFHEINMEVGNAA